MRRSRPDFRTAARQRLADERGVALAAGSLLSPHTAAPATVQVVSIDRLVAHPDIDAGETDAAALEELLESVVELGILAPIVARAHGDGEHLQILDGVRRWRAARGAGHTVVPVIVHDMDDDAARAFAALGRRRRPIPYQRLMGSQPDASRAERVPVVISGGEPPGPG